MVKGKKSTEKKHEELGDSWSEFSKEMNERISDMAKNTQDDLADHFEMWKEYSQKMTDMMARFTPEDEKAFGDIQDLWRDYSDKIGGKFVDVMEREMVPSKELYNIWTERSAKMQKQFSELIGEGMKDQQDLYELWMDSFGIKDNGNESNLPDIYKEMGQFWQSMWARSRDMIPPSREGFINPNANYKEMNELWTDSYSKMVKNMINSPEFAKMDGNILNANLDAIIANNKMVNQYLGALGLPTRNNLEDIYKKLHDMDRKISEMARTLNSRKK